MELTGAVPIPEAECRQYVAEGLWGGRGLRDGIEAWASRTPDRIAIADPARSWSYRDLAADVAAALGCLRSHGVGVGITVLIIAPVTAAAVVAYEAALRSGADVVMVDRRCGPADVEHAVAAADVGLLVTTAELALRLGTDRFAAPTLLFEELLHGAAAETGWDEPDPARPIAAVFTSGTTSRPKGVVHSLDTLGSGSRNLAEAMTLTGRDVAFLSTPLASITGLVQVHMMLDRGAGLVLEDRFAPAASLLRVRNHHVTVIGGAPVILEELFRQAAREGLTDLPVRAMALGGAMIPREVLTLAVEQYGITPVRVYGSSEVPCATTTMPTDLGEARLNDDGACPRGTEVRIDGEPSEIQMRGPMRMLGYLDESDNKEAFVEGGWYRTGDLGRLTGGRLTVTGRLKETVSRKGLKISLSELDDVTRGLPGTEEVAAFGLPDPETGERLAIAVHERRPDAVDFDSVIGWLLDAGLAKWKLPEQIVLWGGPLPRTESGKVQRRRLVEEVGQRQSLLAPRLQPAAAIGREQEDEK